MQGTFLIRSGDIAFALAAAFVLGVAAETFAWSIPALSLLLFAGGLIALYCLGLGRFWPALVAAQIIFLLAAGYCHVSAPAKNDIASFPSSPQKTGSVLGFSSAIFNAVLPIRQSELLGAIVGGSTSGVDAELKSQMSTSGTSYIVNMYGYKINLFVAAILSVSRRFFSRRAALVMAASGAAVFIFLAGAPTTAIRAGIMTGLVLLAQASGRPFHARNIFTFTAAVMLLFDPALLGDSGFQLSFLSLLGIFVLGPPLKRLFRQTGREFLGWKSHAIMALAVNAAIMPVVMAQFGDFSITSFVSNFLIAIPFAAVIGLAIIIVALGAVSVHLAYLAAGIADVFLSYQLWVIKVFSAAVVPLPSFFRSGFSIAVYYFLLAAFVIHYENNQNEIAEII